MENQIGNQRQEELDDIDRYIIDAMRQDGRIAFAQIAQQLNVSPGMIRVRYNRLTEMGVLKVVAITNPLRLGYTTMAMIGIRTDGERMLEVAEQVSAFEEVIYLIVVSGRFDILCEVVCHDHADLLRFLTEKLYKVPGVRESESFMHLRITKEVYF
jgi:Lrp/AsnC family transcriptional regulator, regulator for asnA, asnC and gidA